MAKAVPFTDDDREILRRIDRTFEHVSQQVAGHQKTLYGQDGAGGLVKQVHDMTTIHANCPNRHGAAAADETQVLDAPPEAVRANRRQIVVVSGAAGGAALLVELLIKLAEHFLGG